MQNARIMLHPSKLSMQVQMDGILLVEIIKSANTLKLREHSYPPRHYFSREHVRMGLLTVSETTTYCPFKGRAVYFRMGDRLDIAWSYVEPIEGLEAIADRVVFYEDVSE